MATFSLNKALRPEPPPPDRLSDAAALDIAIAQLSRTQRALIDGITVPSSRGKPRRLSARDRDAILLDEFDRVLRLLRRAR